MSADHFAKMERDGNDADAAEFINRLRFNQDGLIPVVAQRQHDGKTLMLAWMNRDALAQTLATGQMTYYSRSRKQLWRKGETSGNTQRLVEMRADCDGDALLAVVHQHGPACHTGRESCFFFILNQQRASVQQRAPEDPQ